MRPHLCVTLVAALICAGGCTPYWSHQSLEDKVQNLESRVKQLEGAKTKSETEDSQRRQDLQNCITIEAEEVYWDYVRINGKKIKESQYKAPKYVWDQARRLKLDKIEECKILYGH